LKMAIYLQKNGCDQIHAWTKGLKIIGEEIDRPDFIFDRLIVRREIAKLVAGHFPSLTSGKELVN
jgi:hypothetical protein